MSVQGCDISSLQGGRAAANYEHKSGAKGSALDIVGRVLTAKKIFQESDCANDRERAYWNCVKMPLIYGVVRLFDDSGHAGAQALAAMVRDSQSHGGPLMLQYSIEGVTVTKTGHRLEQTVARGVAITIKPANRTCVAGVLDSPAIEKREAEILVHGPELEVTDLELPADLAKTYEAGAADVAPANAVQGAALQKKAPESKGGRVRVLSDHKGPAQPSVRRAAPVEEAPLTVRGKPISPNPALEAPRFDEHNGVLHTPRGSIRMYLPAQDGTEEQFQQLLADPKVEQFHGRAMAGWSRAHRSLKQRKLAGEVVMHAVLHSQMSPNTSVPQQEQMYSKLVDAMRHTGHDPRTPGFEPTIEHWKKLNRPDVYPEHAREHFLGNAGIHTKAGAVRAYNLPDQKAAIVLQYHMLHDTLGQLIQQHGADARAMTQILMTHKVAGENHEIRRQGAVQRGEPDPGPYMGGWLAVPGLAPKTARYAFGMMGGGNVTVPDTHFIRHVAGLEKDVDTPTIEYLKQLWNPRNHHLLEGLDRWYAAKHPAVRFLLDHPQHGRIFERPEDAIFPAFWRHWMTIVPHERLRGMRTGGANELTTHAPYWQAIDPFTKAEGPDETPLLTSLVHQQYVQHLGEVPASMLYAAYLLPRLLDEGARRLHAAHPTQLLAGAAPQLERAVLDLRSLCPTPSQAQGHQQDALWHGGPVVRKISMLGVGPSGYRAPAGRAMVLDGKLMHLEDYHGVLSRLLPEGPVDAAVLARLHALEASPHLDVQLDHVLPATEQQQPAAAPEVGRESALAGETSPGSADTASPPPAPAGTPSSEAYRYKRTGAARESLLEVSGEQAYLDGSPIPGSLVDLMLSNVEAGAATLAPAGVLARAELELIDLTKAASMDPATVLAHIRAAVQAGHLHPDVGDSATAHLYHDPMTSEHRIGNLVAWKEFKDQQRPGVYVSGDANDFGKINKIYGQHVGDQAINAMGGALRAGHDEALGASPGRGKLFRTGGDEFSAWFPSYEHAVKFLHGARNKLEQTPPVGGTHRISFAFGLGQSPEHANMALLEAKKGKSTETGERRYAEGQVPNLAHSLIAGREGSIPLHHEAPPTLPKPAMPARPAAVPGAEPQPAA